MELAEPAAGHDGVVVTENSDGRGNFVVLCDHASNTIPKSYHLLGLEPADMARHIAWDPGALAVSRRLAGRLDAPLVWPDASRLIVDCNRAPDAPDLFVQTGDGVDVPGNLDLSEVERQSRIDAVHAPYHAAIDECLESRRSAGQPTALVAVHSFTPVFRGRPRPWQVGVIFNRDSRLADLLIAGLQSSTGLDVGVNEPYSPDDGVYYTLSRHGEDRGLPAVMIEIRNNEIGDREHQNQWADRLADILARAGREVLADA